MFFTALAIFFPSLSAPPVTFTVTLPTGSFTEISRFLPIVVNESIPVEIPELLYFFSSAAIWKAILPESNAPAHSSSTSSE
jgi:hypothetical protein